MSAKLTQPLKWHGGKHYLAPKIIDLMPPHVHYVEPYAGGLSVLLAKAPAECSEVVGDTNLELTNFWRVLQVPDLFNDFRRHVEATPFSEAEWKRAVENPWSIHECFRNWKTSDYPCPKAAYSFFIRCRMSLAGRMDAFAPLTRNRLRRGMNEQVSAWIGAVEGLPAVHARLMRVAILTRPALEVIESQDGPNTLFYLDPPYLHSTRATKGEYGPHEMSDGDHHELLNALCGIDGKFLLSGYRSELYDQVARLAGWERVEFSRPNNAAGGATKRTMIECVWKNF